MLSYLWYGPVKDILAAPVYLMMDLPIWVEIVGELLFPLSLIFHPIVIIVIALWMR